MGDKEISEQVYKCEQQIMELLNDQVDAGEDIILEQYDWETVEEALIHLLLTENDENTYRFVSWITWEGLLNGAAIRNDILVALLNLRLNTEQNPYDDNTVWSITSRTFGLSYDNSEYNPFHDLRLEMKLNEHGLSFCAQGDGEKNGCAGCPVIADYTKLSKCPECGKESMMTAYDGVCIQYHCQSCGCDILGTSFYPKCRLDETIYTVTISREAYSKEHILLLARMFAYPVVKMKNYCSSSCDLEMQRSFKDSIEIMKQCWEAGMTCSISPMPLYSRFGKCSYTTCWNPGAGEFP